MVRVPKLPKPGAGAISNSVLRGLRMDSSLSPLSVAFVQFSPTLGIAAKRIDKLGVDIRSFREPLTRAIRQVMMPSIAENFNVGGRPAWEPLAEATWDIRKRMGWEGGDILLLSGALRKGASSFKIWTITRENAIIRDLPENIWYGKVHQGGYEGQSMKKLAAKHGGNFGAALKEIQGYQKQIMKGLASRGAGTSLADLGMRIGDTSTIPARPFLVIQPEDEQDIEEIFMEWLEERVNRAWPSVG